MAKKSTASSSAKPRRSERLSKVSARDGLEFLELRRKSVKSSVSRRRKSSCMVSNDRVFRMKNSTTTPTRSVKTEPMTVEELAERELTLQAEERELKKRKISLDARELEIEETLKLREAQTILEHLEEHYQCPLCYEIIACPYMLSPAECGHTFCAICTVKWFFSRLHRGCGTWHESVACPLCRSLLIITPDTVPRPTITIPFAPNRIAENTLKAMVEKLGNICSRPKMKRKQNVITRASCKAGGDDEAKVKLEDAPSGHIGETGVEAWSEGGALRREWAERDRNGRFEMDDLINRWKDLGGQDFVEFKDRLGL
ncbi:hypothetical protein DFH11DRAFT_1214053 [Phellopilus nigrolimitatus]|nr:hypothetical protein DFH11DRAFT_1214053 [Phellopilus nigrolimitatus]